jgi:hypothetical protein
MRFLVLLTIGLFGCADNGEDDDVIAVDPTGVHHQYVIDSITLPSTVSEAIDFGLDLDGDAEGRPDNALGQIFSALSGAGIVDANEKTTEALATGKMLHLIDVQTTSMTDAMGVGALVFLGDDLDDNPDDNFTGSEQIDVRLAGATRTMVGMIGSGELIAGPGQMPAELVLPGVPEPFAVQLEGARIYVSITGDRLQGTLAGAIREEDIDTAILPVILEGVAVSIERDCVGTVCEDNTNGDVFLELFDGNQDGDVTLEELRSSSLINALFRPDVDLFDQNGRFSPRTKGIEDSLSIGFGFTAVPARFDLPF